MRRCKNFKPLAGLGLLLFSLSSLAAAQGADYSPPQLSFGVPDLQGVWSYETRTGLERPAHYEEAGLEIDETAMLDTLEPTDQILDDYQNFGTNRRNDAANVGGYDPIYFSIGESLAYVNGKYRTSIIVDPADGKIPFKEQASATRRQLASTVYQFPASLGRSDGPEGRALSDRCLKAFSSSTPFLSSVYNNNMQIVQSPDYVVLLVEMVHDARIVKIDQQHRDLPYNKWLGDSVGYYEDDTLVVVTKNFNQWEIVNGYGISPSVNTVVTERFRRIADDQILYSFTIDDPDLYTQPWTGEMPMRPSEGMYEYSCHEGNHALPGILAGARRLEKDAEANE